MLVLFGCWYWFVIVLIKYNIYCVDSFGNVLCVWLVIDYMIVVSDYVVSMFVLCLLYGNVMVVKYGVCWLVIE